MRESFTEIWRPGRRGHHILRSKNRSTGSWAKGGVRSAGGNQHATPVCSQDREHCNDVFMMAAGGYSWTVVPVERRDEYMQALEAASVEQNITPFTKFIASLF